jgi:hypothetical protein
MKTIQTILLSTLLLAFSAKAVVLHDDNDSPTNRPTDSVVGRWSSSASAVAIGRTNWQNTDYIITVRHQGGGVGTSVYFGEIEYKIAQQWLNNSVDMRVCRLETTDGNDADLNNFVQWYTGTNEISSPIVIGGFGKGRGSSGTGVDGQYYTWIGTNNLTQRWGANNVDSTSVIPAGSYTSDVIGMQFGNAASKECAVAEWDSGGGWFMKNSQSTRWELVALSAYVEHSGKSYYNPSDQNYGVRVGSYSQWIDSIIPAKSDSPTLILIQ